MASGAPADLTDVPESLVVERGLQASRPVELEDGDVWNRSDAREHLTASARSLCGRRAGANVRSVGVGDLAVQVEVLRLAVDEDWRRGIRDACRRWAARN